MAVLGGSDTLFWWYGTRSRGAVARASGLPEALYTQVRRPQGLWGWRVRKGVSHLEGDELWRRRRRYSSVSIRGRP
jgi:hypothetical protein